MLKAVIIGFRLGLGFIGSTVVVNFMVCFY